MNQKFTIKRITWGLLGLAIVAYILPWTVNIGNSLSMGAYDFAEWLSKRPFDDSSYKTIFLLRGQLVLITWFIMLSAERPYFTLHWWSHLLIAVILVIAQFPPVEFIHNTSDINQQQQAILAFISLIAVPLGASGYLSAYRNITWLIIALMGLGTTFFALINAVEMMRVYHLPAEMGVGAILLILCYVLLGIIAARDLIQTQH
jgi:hypothetical protein